MRKNIKHILTTALTAILMVIFIAGSARPETDKLKPLDVISVAFKLDPLLNEKQAIRPDGMITLQAIGDIKAAGLSPEELAEKITQKFVEANIFSEKDKRGDLTNSKPVTVHSNGISQWPPGTPPTEPCKLKPLDKITCKFILDPQLNERDEFIRPDGMITLQAIGDIKAAGLRPEELAERITQKFIEAKIFSKEDQRGEEAPKNYKLVTVHLSGISQWPPGTPPTEPYKLKPLDKITCKFILDPQLNEKDEFIRPDGMITLQAIGDIKAAGLRPEELAEKITQRFIEAKIFSKEEARGELKDYKLVTVHLNGISQWLPGTPPTEPCKLKPLDKITCKFILDPQLNEIDEFIRPDGMITVQAMGDVKAAGLRPEELAERITQKFIEAKIFVQEGARGELKDFKLVTVHLGGISQWPPGTPPTEPYNLKPLDTITCKFILNPKLNARLPIRPDGAIKLKGVGSIIAAGLKTEELAERITQKCLEANIFSKEEKREGLKNYKLVTIHLTGMPEWSAGKPPTEP